MQSLTLNSSQPLKGSDSNDSVCILNINAQLVQENQELRRTIHLLEDKLAQQTLKEAVPDQQGERSFKEQQQWINRYWDTMAWLLTSQPIQKRSNSSGALLALIGAVTVARQINEHILARWNKKARLPVDPFRLPPLGKNSALAITEESRSVTASICNAAVAMRNSGLRGRLMIRSHQLSSLRRFAKSAENAYTKTEAKLKEKATFSPIWPVSTPVFPSDECKANAENQMQSNLQLFIKGDQNIEFPNHPAPVVSVVICVYNKPEFLLRTLEALQLHADIPYEVIIWDDCSPCDMSLLYQKVTGAKIIRSKRNLNFVLANNEAAQYAKGEYLLLLNSDAAIRSEALSSSVNTFLQHPKIGVVGGCLILPDGNVQEAGNVVWRDGSCASIGRGLLPNDMRLQSYRQVHYCSGAFMMTRTELWRKLGGFDPQFAPAYYEETDFCLRTAKDGWLVVYNPHAKIDHYEFATNGKNAAVGLMLQNRDKLLNVHGDVLGKHPMPLKWHDYFFDQSPLNSQKKWLFLDDQFPTSAAGAGFPRAQCILQSLNSHMNHEVWFVATQVGSEIKREESDAGLNWTHAVSFKCRASLIQFLSEEVSSFDAVFVSRPHNKMILDEALLSLISPKPFIIYDAEAIFAERNIAQHKLTHLIDLPKEKQRDMLAAEIHLAQDADLIITVSEKDSSKFKELLPENTVFHLDYIARESRVKPIPFHDRKGLLFVGPLLAENTPNTDGFRWLLEEVTRHFTKEFLPVHLTHAGKNLISDIHSTGAIYLNSKGPVESLDTYFSSSRVFLCPIRFAAGISLKAIEALGAGTPMVCTPIIADQLGLVHEKHALVAEDAKSFAQCIERLYNDSKLWESISKNGRAFILSHHSAEMFNHNFQRMLTYACSKMDTTGSEA